MKMLTRNMISTGCVLLLSCLSVAVNSDSLADRVQDSSPINTWGEADLAMKRIMMMTDVEPTAAGAPPEGYDPSGIAHNSSQEAGSVDIEKATSNASRIKREVFGSN